MATARTITILKPGTFTDIRGTKVTFSRADLEGLVASYDAASDPAPLVVGHPTIDAPAYGWVSGLRMEGDAVVADPDRVAAAFAEAVNEGRYRKISPQLYPPNSPANPKPGRWYLQHVGFLGGAAPAIKGLGTVSFAEAGDDVFAPVITQETIMTTETEADAVAFAEAQAALDTRTSELDAREQAIAEREAAAAAAEQSARHDTNVAFAEGLVTGGTLAPAGKDTVVALLDQLGALDSVSFGEGDAATQIAPVDMFKSLFDGAHPVVAFGEVAGTDTSVPPGTVTVSFAAPPGYSVDPAQAVLHTRARELQVSNPSLTFWDAVTRARTETAG